jgi:hypothetical protein
MSRATRWLVTFDALLFVAAVVLEFTAAGPISRWWDGRPYHVLAPDGSGVIYHVAYFIFFCLMPALHILAIITKERVLIRNQ